MRHDIVLSPDAVAGLKRLRAYDRVAALDAIEQHLTYEPTRASRSRIKRLRDLRHPQYRLRIDDLRVFYDVAPGEVQIVAILTKEETAGWLARWGIYSEE